MRRFILCASMITNDSEFIYINEEIMNKWKLGLLFTCFCSLFLFVSCNSDNQEKEDKSAQSDGLKLNLLEPIVPLADGGAYVVSNGEVWYLRSGEAIKVKKVEKFSAQLSAGSKTLLSTRLEKTLWTFWRNEVEKGQRTELEDEQLYPSDPQ